MRRWRAEAVSRAGLRIVHSFLGAILLIPIPLIAAAAMAQTAEKLSVSISAGAQDASSTVASAPSQAAPAPASSDGWVEDPPKSCPTRTAAIKFEDFRHGHSRGETPIWRLAESPAFFFVAGMTIDADGAPNTYNPENTGLDDLRNAGEPGHWDGVIQDENGEPFVQGPEDPFPGYYISCTSLSDRTKGRLDPTRYVDATQIPYIVLPGGLARDMGARLGDFAVVTNLRNGKSSYAIFADVGTFGEGSVALAQNLGIDSDARSGGSRGRILYLIFPGSGNGRPRTVDEINTETDKLLQDWGGAERLASCATNEDPPAAPATVKPVDTDPSPAF
jgi:hypothetical protein